MRVPPGAGARERWENLEAFAHGHHTLLHIIDEGLQLGVCLRLLSQGVQQQVVLRGACYVCLPQPSLQQPDLGLLLRHL